MRATHSALIGVSRHMYTSYDIVCSFYIQCQINKSESESIAMWLMHTRVMS